MVNDILKVRGDDISSIIHLLIAVILAWIIRRKDPRVWIIVERINDAQDNSWLFYQWVRKKHPEQSIYFILDKHAPGFDKADKTMVSWGGLKHWVLYLASDIHIMATFLTPMPNSRICSRLEKYFKKNVKRVYLKHGIIYNGLEQHVPVLLYSRLFFCGAKPEYDYISNYSDYARKVVKYTGLARYDELLEKKNDGHYIFITPTWRRYLGGNSDEKENEHMFLESEYYKRYVSLLQNKELLNFAKKYNYKIIYNHHAEYRKFESLFPKIDGDVVCYVKRGESIHNYLMGASILITDYSSVFFDVAYMEKPVIFYQFDLDRFRREHLSEGYFSYERDGMGPVVNDEASLVEAVKDMFDGKSFYMPDKYKERTNRFFTYRDTKNCERIYQEILKI